MKDHQPVKIPEEHAIPLILIVEHDRGIGEFLTEALSQSNSQYQIAWVNSGVDALKVTKFLKPSLFIIDYWLPDVNAVTLYDLLHVRGELADVPAIVLSTHLNFCEQELQRRKIVGLDLPFDLDTFLQNVEKALERE